MIDTFATVPVTTFQAVLLIALNLVCILVAGGGIGYCLFFLGFVGDLDPESRRVPIRLFWLTVVGLLLAAGVFLLMILCLLMTGDWPRVLQTLPFVGFALWYMFVRSVFRRS